MVMTDEEYIPHFLRNSLSYLDQLYLSISDMYRCSCRCTICFLKPDFRDTRREKANFDLDKIQYRLFDEYDKVIVIDDLATLPKHVKAWYLEYSPLMWSPSLTDKSIFYYGNMLSDYNFIGIPQISVSVDYYYANKDKILRQLDKLATMNEGIHLIKILRGVNKFAALPVINDLRNFAPIVIADIFGTEDADEYVEENFFEKYENNRSLFISEGQYYVGGVLYDSLQSAILRRDPYVIDETFDPITDGLQYRIDTFRKYSELIQDTNDIHKIYYTKASKYKVNKDYNYIPWFMSQHPHKALQNLKQDEIGWFKGNIKKIISILSPI